MNHRILIVSEATILAQSVVRALSAAIPQFHASYTRDLPALLDRVVSSSKGFESDWTLLIIYFTDDISVSNSDLEYYINAISEHVPRSPWLVVTENVPEDALEKFIHYNLSGIVPISYSFDQFVSAVQLIASGEKYFPAYWYDNSNSTHQDPIDIPVIERKITGNATQRNLTPRQLEVLDLLVKGLSNKQIARTLNLANNTVKVHVSEVIRKLGASSRTHAVALASDSESKENSSRNTTA